MSSGVAVNDACLDIFQELKLRKKYKYILYKLSDDRKEIVLESAVESSSGATYDDFVASLPAEDCRYAIYDFEYEKPGEGIRNKICFITWSPDTAKIKSKMVYASSKDAIRKKLVGFAVEVQGTDFSEVDYEIVLEKVQRSSQ